jgi:hypothetical protein
MAQDPVRYGMAVGRGHMPRCIQQDVCFLQFFWGYTISQIIGLV